MGRGCRGRPAEHRRPAADLHRAGRRARRRRGHRRLVHDRAAGGQLLLRAGHRLHARVPVRGGGQTADLRAQHGLPGHDQGNPERPRRTRRLSLRRRHRLLSTVRQERPACRRPEPHRSPHRGAFAESRHRRPGRVSHHPSGGIAAGAGARAGRRVSRPAGRCDRLSDPGAEDAVRRHPAAGAGTVGRRQPCHGRGGAESGQLHAERGRATAVLLRPHPGAGGPGFRRVRSPHRPPLRARARLPPRRRRLRAAGPGQSDPHRGSGRRSSAQAPPSQGGGARPGDVPAVSRRSAGARAAGQARRHRARAARPAAGGGSAAGPGDPRRSRQVPGERPPRRRAAPRRLTRLYQVERSAGDLLCRVRPGQQGSHPRRSHRRGGKHAAGRRRAQAVLPEHRFRPRSTAASERADSAAAAHRRLPAPRAADRQGQREPQPHARGLHDPAHAFHRRLGRHHHRQAPGIDAVRPARLSRQSQPQVRLREEGSADHVLPGRGARADPRQRRVRLRRRGAVAGSQRVQSQRCAERAARRRAVHHPGGGRQAGAGVGAHSAALSAADRRPQHPLLLPRRLQDRAGGSHRRGSRAAHAGHRLPGRVLRRDPAAGRAGLR